MIKKLLEQDRLYKFLFKKLKRSTFFDSELFEIILNYTTEYCTYAFLTKEDIADIYNNFIKSYNIDVKKFKIENKYPVELGNNTKSINRIHYDVILLMSVLLTPHRFRIMQLIISHTQKINDSLIIGCGPGLEIELIKSKTRKLTAYDLTISDFVKKHHNDVSLKEELFVGRDHVKKFDTVFLIEILEHLKKPYQFLDECKESLKENGKILLTTATNIPQFDHLYNFEASHDNFEKKVQEMGLVIDYCEDIPHSYLTTNIGSKNRFYILKNK